MLISLQLEPHPGYLLALLAGVFTLDEAEAVSLRFLQASAEHHLPNVLVDVRQVLGQPTVAERYAYSEFVAIEVLSLAAGGGPVMRLAYVGYAPLMDPNRFGVMVARNRGVQVTVTEDVNEALQWLGVPPA